MPVKLRGFLVIVLALELQLRGGGVVNEQSKSIGNLRSRLALVACTAQPKAIYFIAQIRGVSIQWMPPGDIARARHLG